MEWAEGLKLTDDIGIMTLLLCFIAGLINSFKDTCNGQFTLIFYSVIWFLCLVICGHIQKLVM